MLLLAQNTYFTRKIIGIHSSGAPSAHHPAFATPVSQELLELLLSRVDDYSKVSTPEVPERRDYGLTESTDLSFTENAHENEKVYHPVLVQPIPGNVTVHGRVEDAPFRPSKTNIFPSPISGMLSRPTTAPAILRKMDGVDPFQKAYQKVTGPPSKAAEYEDDIKICVQEVFDVFDKGVEEAKAYSYDEAVKGVEGEEFVDALNRQSSAGYPWRRKPGFPGKTTWFGREGEFEESAEVREAVEKRIRESENKTRPLSFWTDTLKDERRDLERVEAKKTRMFSAGDMAYNIHFRMFFLSFCKHIMKGRISNGSCVGINPFYMEWTQLVHHLQKRGNASNIIAGDFSNFDGTLGQPLLWLICEKINEWYTRHAQDKQQVQFDNNQRTMLFFEIVNSIHLADGDIVQWNQSQPSGNPFTAIVNTIYNLACVRIAWRLGIRFWMHAASVGKVFLCVNENGLKVLRTMTVRSTDTLIKEMDENQLRLMLPKFDKYVVAVAYGDDNLLSISSEVGWFTQELMTIMLRKIGMEYTDDEKHGISEFRSLGHVHFLKRGFEYSSEKKRWLAPLKFGTVLEMTNWVHGSADRDASCALNLESSHRELSMYPRSVFEEWTEKYRFVASRINIPVALNSYDDIHALWESGDRLYY